MKSLKPIGVVLTFAAIIGAGMMSSSKLVRARAAGGGDECEQARIHRGLVIARVPLNLEGKDRDLVGLGTKLFWVLENRCTGNRTGGSESLSLRQLFLHLDRSW